MRKATNDQFSPKGNPMPDTDDMIKRRIADLHRKINALSVDRVIEVLRPVKPKAELFGKRSAERMHAQDIVRLEAIRDGLITMIEDLGGER